MYPPEYIEFLYHFHCDRDYFECHEILEELWKKDPKEERKQIWVGLIQIAVSFYHYRRKNFNGAERMMKNAIRILKNETASLNKLGLDDEQLLHILQNTFGRIQKREPYKSIQLPIFDQNLYEICLTTAKERGKKFGEPSDISNVFLIHKHKTRDRTDIIEERLKNWHKKRKRRE